MFLVVGCGSVDPSPTVRTVEICLIHTMEVVVGIIFWSFFLCNICCLINCFLFGQVPYFFLDEKSHPIQKLGTDTLQAVSINGLGNSNTGDFFSFGSSQPKWVGKNISSAY